MKTFYSLLLCSIVLTLSAQDNQQLPKEIIEKYSNHQLVFKEKIFLHINKSTYYSGEKVWFKAYMVNDKNNILSEKTSNLYVNLYGPENELISSQLFFAKNGIAHGNLKLPEESVSGLYHLNVETNALRNFNKNNEHITPINIINLNQSIPKDQNYTLNSKTSPVTLEFYPESNVLLESRENIMGVKASKNKNPIATKGVIVDNNQKEIAPFFTNRYGIGKCKFKALPGKTYRAIFKYDSESFSVDLPRASKNGIIIHVKRDNKKSYGMELLLKTNDNTLSKIAGKQYFLIIHRKENVSSVLPVKFTEKHNQYSIKVPEDTFFEGINEVTLFNNNNLPISHRYFYHRSPYKNVNVSANVKGISGDSLVLQIQTKNHLLQDIKTELSISVLPSKTKNYKNLKNIYTTFLLDSYLDQKLAYASSYYNESNPEAFLNLALLNTKKKGLFRDFLRYKELNNYKPETGLTVQGAVNLNRYDGEPFKVLLTSKENEIMLIKELKEDNTFVFDSLHLTHPSNYELSLLNAKGKPVDAGFYIKKKNNLYKPDSLLSPSIVKKVTHVKINNKYDQQVDNLPLLKEGYSIRKLKEVTVTGSKADNNYNHLLPSNKIPAASLTKTYKFDENTPRYGINLFHLIDNLPEIDARQLIFGDRISVISTRGPRTLAKDFDPNMLIIIDGIIVSDLSILQNFMADDIIEVIVNLSGAGYGLRGGNGVLLIKTKNSPDYKLKKTEHPVYRQNAISIAFAPQEAYENFPLNFVNMESEEYFSTIGWFPNPEYNSSESYEIKVPKTVNEKIKLIINGVDVKGSIFFEEMDIPVDGVPVSN